LSTIIGSIPAKVPSVDKAFNGTLHFLSTIEINDRIFRLIMIATDKVAEQLKADELENLKNVWCIFSNSDEITLKLDPEQGAIRVSLCVYPVKKWLDNNYDDIKILMCLMEELCHHYWEISDEIQVKRKVLQVMSRIFPYMKTLKDLYCIESLEETYNVDLTEEKSNDFKQMYTH